MNDKPAAPDPDEVRARLAEWLQGLSDVMVEVCDPHPGNPSENIFPVARRDLLAALASATEAPPVAGGSGGDALSGRANEFAYPGLLHTFVMGHPHRAALDKLVAQCAELANKTPKAGESDPLWWERQSSLMDAAVNIADFLRMIDAALTKPTPPASVSGEVVVVPREPTEAMLKNAWRIARPGTPVARIWTAMLATAPEAATPSAVERTAIVAWLRQQSEIGADHGIAAEKGTTKRAAFGGGSLALKRAADAIEAGEHIANDNAPNKAPSAVGGVDRMREHNDRVALDTLSAAMTQIDRVRTETTFSDEVPDGERHALQNGAQACWAMLNGMQGEILKGYGVRLPERLAALATGETSPERGAGE